MKPKQSNAPRSRCRLHVDKLNEFVEFCKCEGWTRVPIKGDYEVLRMTHPDFAGPLLVHQRHDAKVHLTIHGHSTHMFNRFINDVRDRQDPRADAVHHAAPSPPPHMADPAPQPPGELVISPPWS